MNKAWTFRPAAPGDLPFIYDYWLNSFRDSKWAGVVTNDQYRAIYTRTLQDLFKRGMKVLLAVSVDDPDTLVGFMAYEVRPSGEYVIHYCYLKDYMRGQGLVKEFLTEIGCPAHFCYTFRTRSAPPGNGRWVPEIARRLKL